MVTVQSYENIYINVIDVKRSLHVSSIGSKLKNGWSNQSFSIFEKLLQFNYIYTTMLLEINGLTLKVWWCFNGFTMQIKGPMYKDASLEDTRSNSFSTTVIIC